jgi:large subunit ribosomal protein L23
MMRTIWSVLRGPVITEKALEMKEAVESYGRGGNERQILTFRVDPKATKVEIREAVERILKVKVDSVRTINYAGKMKRVGRFEGRRAGWKKAYVTLAAGQNPVEYDEVI